MDSVKRFALVPASIVPDHDRDETSMDELVSHESVAAKVFGGGEKHRNAVAPHAGIKWSNAFRTNLEVVVQVCSVFCGGGRR